MSFTFKWEGNHRACTRKLPEQKIGLTLKALRDEKFDNHEK